MSVVQPDLFGDLDRAEEAAQAEEHKAEIKAQLRAVTMSAGSVACIYCRTVEPTPWRLGSNHWTGSPWQVQNGDCIARALTRNHIAYAIRHNEDPSRYLARGRELRLDVDAIIRELEAAS